jgi:Leucine-rich repeat (LRR) protein
MSLTSNRACPQGDAARTCRGSDIARQFAAAADVIGNRIAFAPASRRTARSAGSITARTSDAAASTARAEQLAYNIGVQTARQLGWKRSDYTRAELAALGKQLIADHALHGNTADRVRLLAALAIAANKKEPSSTPPDLADRAEDDHDKLADHIQEFLHTNFHDTFAVSRAAADLAAERPPARDAGASDAEFSRRFDAYIESATEKTLVLFEKWLSWIGTQHRAEFKDTSIEIQAARLERYRREVLPSVNGMRFFERSMGEEVAAKGYVLTIHSRPVPYRYFLSTADGGVHPIPENESATYWMIRHPETVFGMQRQAPADPGWFAGRSRVALFSVGQGMCADMRTWLASPLRKRFEQSRPAAQQPGRPEEAIDTLLNFIPFRTMLVAIRDKDYKTAAISGTVDAMALAIPMLCSGLPLSIGAAQEAISGTRMAGQALVVDGMTRIGDMAYAPADLRTIIKASLQSLARGNGLAGELRALDVDSMAAALRDSHPRVANALERAGERARGIGISDDWRLADMPAAPAREPEIGALDTVAARDGSGDTVSLLPYGKETARAYTLVTPAGERTGAILLADAEGRLYPSLPADTLERYCITDTELRHELGAYRPGADGVISLRGKRYARIVDEYVEIAREHAANRESRVWRVVAPHGARRDVVFHRISYDQDREIWRRTDIGGLKGGGGAASSCRNACVEPETNPQAQPAQSHPPDPPAHSSDPVASSAASATTALPFALSSTAPRPAKLGDFKRLLLTRVTGAPAATRLGAVKRLLDKVASHPRGKAILNAMCACHELTGQAPDIVLRQAADSSPLRSSLERPMGGLHWRLDIDALNTAGLDPVINELAAVYNNMTGILRGNLPFTSIVRSGRPALAGEDEAALARWVGTDKGHYSVTDPSQFIPSPRQMAADNLRVQLRMARCYGGVDRTTLVHALRNVPGAGAPGLALDLSGLRLGDIPPLPADVHTLRIDNNPIHDWRNLPRNLRALRASRTGGIAELLDHLPSGVRDLDLSDNVLDTIPGNRLPRGLVRFAANGNLLTEVPAGLPDSLRHLTLSDNVIATWPADLPRALRVLRLAGNRLRSVSSRLPPDLDQLDLSRNMIRSIRYDALPHGLTLLDLSDNPGLGRLPALPHGLRVLYVESTGLTCLPENLPCELVELYAGYLGLRMLPNNLPRGLTLLSLSQNLLTELPPGIVELTRCDIYLDDNPLPERALPRIRDGLHGPVFHLSSASPPRGRYASRTIAQAIGRMLGPESEAVARWETIAEQNGGTAEGNRSLAQFRNFLDRLRSTTAYRDGAFQADIREWLLELSDPERAPLLRSTLEVCDGATETCDDRVVWTLNELRKLQLHDDIRLGRYHERPADALRAMRQLFRLQKLQDIAYRKVEALRAPYPSIAIDEIEVYLAYIVKLRDALSLSAAPVEMDFYGTSRVTDDDLTAARREVLSAERTEFYRHLVIDDTWNAFIKQQLPARYQEAERQLIEQTGTPLRQRVHSELRARGLDPDDMDAYRNIAPYIWRDMKYDILEPLTRDYLAAQEIPLRRRRRMPPAPVDAGALSALPPYRIGQGYIAPPWLHSALVPRFRPSLLPLPTLRSKISP